MKFTRKEGMLQIDYWGRKKKESNRALLKVPKTCHGETCLGEKYSMMNRNGERNIYVGKEKESDVSDWRMFA